MRFDLRAPLQALKDQAIIRIDSEAEKARLLWITPGAGQAAAYLLKKEEANAFLALSPQDQAAAQPQDWPMLASEIGITSETLLGVAQVVRGMYQLWVGVASAIENTRLGAKAAVTAATSVAQIDAVVAGLTWPTP